MPSLISSKIASLQEDMPLLFEQATVCDAVSDDYVFVPIKNVESVQATAPIYRNREGDVEDEVDLPSLEEATIDSLDDLVFKTGPVDHLVGQFSVLGAGGPIKIDRLPDLPPADAFAFYLPFHFYAPTWWGVYLTLEGVARVAQEIRTRSGRSVPSRDAFAAAKLFLYYHEAFHHQVECFATRLELSHRKPLFKHEFQALFSRVFGTDNCIEEGLANAYAYKNTKAKIKTAALSQALEDIICASPPGYRRGVEFMAGFRKKRSEFAEENFHECFPWALTNSGRAWETMGHLFDGIDKINGRVNYILRRGSSLMGRVGLRPLLPPRRVIEKIREKMSFDFVRHGANHDIYRAENNVLVQMPRHPGDLTKGVLRSILRQAGIEGGLAEFLAQ